MESLVRDRGRELAVLVAGLGSALALSWAGLTIHGNLRSAGEAAVHRLAAAVADTVVAEWERMLRAPEPPCAPAGEVLRWSSGEEPLAPLVLAERWGAPAERSVFDTLLAEAERRELSEQDPRAALELVLEALEREPSAEHRPEGLLRALQLAARLDEPAIAGARWRELRSELGPLDAREGVPYLALAWIALPASLRDVPASELLPPETLERLFLEEDRLQVADPLPRFILAPMLAALCGRLGIDAPPSEQRRVAALRRAAGELPAIGADGSWHLLELAGRPFLARAERGACEGFFHGEEELLRALDAQAGLPDGFVLDFGAADGRPEPPEPLVGGRTPLPRSRYAFLLRHADPGRIARAESARLALLRAALLVLAGLCAAGGFWTARALSRERRLATLKSAFIAGVSHDLRTPLASILLLAENLELGRASAENRARYHRSLRREAERLRRLVDDVLDFSRLERGQATQLEFEELELERFLADLTAECRERVEEAGGSFRCVSAPVPVSALLDPLAVRRAIGNLLENALKHGGGEVTLAWTADASHLRLALEDRGPGVPGERREAIFRPFESRAANGSGHAGGTGLGLTIVRSIARGHGGEVRVRPGANGKGACFELELPLGVTGET